LSFKTTGNQVSLQIFDEATISMADSKFLTGLGARIRELRLKKDMTQNDLAVHCDFEKASMSRIEAGKTNITVLTLHKISKALDVELNEFFKPDGKVNI
jgi:transcriptional regulator with XRE-family HTH domain